MAKANLKQHIIDTASKLFYSHGYNKTGINEVIAKSDIAKATLYHHFKSKEELGLAYLKQRHDFFLKGLEDFTKNANSPKAKLTAIFDLLRELYRDDDFQGCWGQRMLGEISKTDKILFEAVRQQKNEVLSFLDKTVEENSIQLSRAQIEKIAQSIYLLYESAITESYLHGSDWPIYMAKNLALDGVLKEI
ncbi:TetR family transcriptional regulator [Croceivirga thetidis]|uniref:TetR/AcrR family transcriptional regulator n=1 Tax=Croceivirga thetidis TaxID=2721623 RepID=A0ABX1GN73_9FLAO|nr:TetR/AcrR family transcriptional regulator [Croceivirga thetidis]